ncbi:MAG: hypothetical protein CMK09_02365 [Ponticaulis sp.]|nr:hypothetical protein [Ponticaulis sp.]
MKSLIPHLRAIYGVAAVFITLIFLQAVAYKASLEFGDLSYVFGAVALTMLAVLYGARWEGLAFPSMISMTLSFGLVSGFTSANWFVRRILFDIQTPFDQSEVRNAVIVYVILPLVIASILLPPIIRFARQDKVAADVF